MNPLRVVIAGGGTGGHLYPGIAVAREIAAAAARRGGDVRRDGAGHRVAGRAARGLRAGRAAQRRAQGRRSLAGAGARLSLLPLSGVDAWRILSRRRPDVVIGVGGYSSGPVVLAAAARGIPTLLLEQNAVPGLTNRLLARVVSSGGGDVRIDACASSEGGDLLQATLFVLSSSTCAAGAGRRPAAGPDLWRLPGRARDQHGHGGGSAGAGSSGLGLEITHQTGERDLELVRDGYRRAGLEARVEPFLYDMAREMKLADLVVCRAGATTIAELTASARPAIFIPLPTAADDHQRVNAEVLVRPAPRS